MGGNAVSQDNEGVSGGGCAVKFCFGDIVVVNGDEIGVVVKSWQKSMKGREPEHEVYCRMSGIIETFTESQMQRYMVRHKYLNEEELQWQANTQIN